MSRSFNGTTSDYMRSVVGALSGFPVSLSVWVRPTSAGVRGVPIWFGNPGSNDGVLYVELLAAGNVFAGRQIIDFGAGNFAGATAGAWTVDTWQQVGGSYASATSIYAVLNGVRSAEQTASSAALTFAVMDELTLGRYDRTSVFGSQNGQIAHAAIWSAALTETEWASLGAGISPMRVRPQSLHAYFPFLGRNTNDIDIIRAKTFTATGTTVSSNEPRFFWPSRRRTIYLDTVNNVREATDFATITDALIESSFRNRAASENASLADALIEFSFRNRTSSESSTLVDAFIDSRLRGRLSSEGSTIDDALSQSSFRNRDSLEGATLADSILESSFRNRTSSDAVSSVADEILSSARRSRIASDGIAALDEALRSILRTRLVGDSSTLIDEFISTVTTSGPTIYAFTATETLVLIDLAIEQLSLSRVSSDALVAEDALILSALRRRILSEAATATDESLRQVTRNRILLDAAILVDASATSTQRNRASSESLSILDEALTARQANRTASESLNVAEAVARSLSRAIFTSDLVTVAEATLLVRQMTAQVSEALSISEIIAKSLILSSYFDVRVLLGTLARNSETVLGSSESISLSASDGPTLGSYS